MYKRQSYNKLKNVLGRPCNCCVRCSTYMWKSLYVFHRLFLSNSLRTRLSFYTTESLSDTSVSNYTVKTEISDSKQNLYSSPVQLRTPPSATSAICPPLRTYLHHNSLLSNKIYKEILNSLWLQGVCYNSVWWSELTWKLDQKRNPWDGESFSFNVFWASHNSLRVQMWPITRTPF